MKKIVYLLLLLPILFLFSCSDDNPVNPENSDLNGTWSTELIQGYDTVRCTVVITESKGKISGTGDLYIFHKIVSGSSSTSESSTNKGNITGTYEGGVVKINFSSTDFDKFEGVLSEDKTSISGKVSTILLLSQNKVEYNITLLKN
ncbi:hypothetical protein MASR1M45_21120 [Candidatus Kapaibacterium sp.]